MRPLHIFSIGLIFTACGQSGGKGYISEDSLGIKRIDTASRNDTMNYERMLQKTGTADSTSSSNSQRGDTAYYERLPQKSQQKKDSSQR